MPDSTPLDLSNVDLSLSGLQSHYRNKDFSPAQLIDALLVRADAIENNPIWITRLNRCEIQVYLTALAEKEPEHLPLYGVPFAIKDNIDLQGIPTTAACPAFSYVPETSATVVTRLIEAGAIPIGKTNMDQFATGLVGVRSPQPWGPCRNAFNEKIISGGSSSGSAVALSLGLVSFSLGTDTAGSGRVPASLNNLVGLKPTRGLLSCKGVVPACKSLDCVSIFALNCDDANQVFDIAACHDAEDPYSRKNTFANGRHFYRQQTGTIKLGIPKQKDLNFFGSQAAEQLFRQFMDTRLPDNIEKVEIDFEPFLQAARLLYQGPWVTERYIAVQSIFEDQPEALLPVIKTIIGSGKSPSAADTFHAMYRLQNLRQQADAILDSVDAILTPTMPRGFSIEEVENNPIELNSQLGYYTNFMNLLDCAAVAFPIGFLPDKAGFGATLFHKSHTDKHLLSIAAHLQNALAIAPGASGAGFKQQGIGEGNLPGNSVDIVVCGAHLEGLPLNWQLTERHGKLVLKTHTSKNYGLYALPGGPPFRPALVRRDNSGNAIEVEVWRVPAADAGNFIAQIPAPLGIGKVELADGRWLSGFICDSWGLQGAEDISQFGGWRAYIKSLNP